LRLKLAALLTCSALVCGWHAAVWADSTITALADGGRALFDDVTLTARGAGNRKHTIEDLFGFLGYGLHQRRVGVFDDFLAELSTTSTPTFEVNSGTGAATAHLAATAVNRPGLARSTTGTTLTGRAAVMTSAAVWVAGSGALTLEIPINPATLSTSAERYQFVAGLFDTATAANQVDCICFVYDEGGISTGSTAAAYWQTATVANSVRTWNTALVQTTVSAGAWTTLRIDVNAAGTSVAFFVNGSSIATHTATIPTGTARAFGAGWLLIKSVGTTARTVDADFLLVDYDLTTPR
jgi:hypothetical protein